MSITSEWQNCEQKIDTDLGSVKITSLVDYDWLESSRDESIADAVMYHWPGVTREQALDAIALAREIKSEIIEA